MFDVRRLQTLHAVSVHGSLGEAARSLNFTPSAVSQQLAVLEREAGCVLLVRKGRGVELTEPGRLLAAHAETVLDQMAAARSALDGLNGTAAGVVRVAAFPTALRRLLVPAVRQLAETHPDIEVRLVEAETEQSIPMLGGEAADLAIVHSYDLIPRVLPPRATVTHVLDDPMLIAVPSRHPSADSDDIRIRQLRGERWIAPGVTTSCFEFVQRACGAAGFVPDIVASSTEYASTLSLVAAGVGVAFVPKLALGTVDHEGVAIRTLRPRRVRHIHLLGPTTPTSVADAVGSAIIAAAS